MKSTKDLIKKLPIIPAITLEDEIDSASLDDYERFAKKYRRELEKGRKAFERKMAKYQDLSQKMYELNKIHVQKVVELKPKLSEPMYWETNSSTSNYDIYICVKVAQKKA